MLRALVTQSVDRGFRVLHLLWRHTLHFGCKDGSDVSLCTVCLYGRTQGVGTCKLLLNITPCSVGLLFKSLKLQLRESTLLAVTIGFIPGISSSE